MLKKTWEKIFQDAPKKSGSFEIFLGCPRNIQMFEKKFIVTPTFLALWKNPDARKFWAFGNFYAA